MSRPKRQKSIFVVRLSHVTDVVLASPMARLIKRSGDNVILTWVVQARYASLIAGHPDIDNLIIWDKDYWLSLLTRGKLITLARERLLVFASNAARMNKTSLWIFREK
ncbi:glycosyltransferase family 9 protein [Teredinibacter purpureus]|uniref:glycosyltransferase family 9 protein n=1 Tax=Teredinibacter purpureus TaxID=2731756 RepID=UPI001F1C0834|nr:hypothetical protein [Teredinibacter purpureus]